MLPDHHYLLLNIYILERVMLLNECYFYSPNKDIVHTMLRLVTKMAETPRDKTSVVCGICLEQYKDPKILPCSHTFCLGCLEKTLNMRKEKRDKARGLDQLAMATNIETQLEGIKQGKICADHESVEVPDEKETALPSQFVYKESVDHLESANTVFLDTAVENSEDEDPNSEHDITADNSDVLCYTFKAEKEKEVFKCPVCNREHMVPVGGMGGFETDFEAVQTIEYDRLQKSLSKPQNCESCGEAKKLASHCTDCGGSICQECSNVHRKLVGFAKHKVVSLTDLTPEGYCSLKKTQICSLHDEAVTYYCTHCSKLICHVCFFKEHRASPHNVLDINEADSRLSERVKRVSIGAKETHKLFLGYCRYIEKVELDVIGGENAKELKGNINAVFDEKIRQLQEERECILRKVEDHESASKKEIWAAKDMIKMVISNLEAGLRFMEKAQHCGNPADRISMNSESSKILAKVTKSKWSNDSLPRPLTIDVPPQIPYQSPCGELVEITADNVDISLPNTAFFFARAQIGRQVQIEVTMKVNPVQAPSFQILYGKSQKVFEPIVMYETEPSAWSISFVPRCGGKHRVQVWIGGLDVASKDFNVEGMPRIGEKVQPGPDWNPPDSTTLYLEGKVTKARRSKCKVVVDWSLDKRSGTDELEEEDTIQESVDISTQEYSHDGQSFEQIDVSGSTLVSLSSEPEEDEEQLATAITEQFVSLSSTQQLKVYDIAEEPLTSCIGAPLSPSPIISSPPKELHSPLDIEPSSILLQQNFAVAEGSRVHKWGEDGLFEVELLL